jgi:nitric oxide reductase large subunit
MSDILKLLVLCACMAMVLACICRVNKLNTAKRHKHGWALLYIAYAAAACCIALDLLASPDTAAWYALTPGEWWALLGLGLSLLLTRKHWLNCPPPITERGDAS